MTNEVLKPWQVSFLNYILNIEQSFLSAANSMNDLSVGSCADIYKRGYNARLVESLGDTYSATWWVLGDEDFLELASGFVREIPSINYDLSDYGEEFFDFLKDRPVIAEIPFVYDLARFEWNFKSLFHSQDSPVEENIFGFIGANPDAKIRLLPSIILWQSNFAIYKIWKQREGDITSLNEIDLDIGESILCRKLAGKVHMSYLEESELRMLNQFLIPRSIEEAVISYQNLFGELTPESIQSLFSRIGALGVLGVAPLIGAAPLNSLK